jgi:hypothetical protein
MTDQGTTDVAAQPSGQPAAEVLEQVRKKIGRVRIALIVTGVPLVAFSLVWGIWLGGLPALLAAMGAWNTRSVVDLIREKAPGT